MVSESGHAMNVANFKKIIERCEGFGAVYDPTNGQISIAHMTFKWSVAEILHHEYLTALSATKIPVFDREKLFDELMRVAFRSIQWYASNGKILKSVKDTKELLNKMRCIKQKVKRHRDGTPDPKQVSSCQLSYVMRTEYFSKLIEIYKADVNYCPNEPELQISNMEELLYFARKANERVHRSIAQMIVKRTERDHALYDVGVGLYDLSMSCKNYVKGLFGAISPEAKSILGIRLKRFMKLFAV